MKKSGSKPRFKVMIFLVMVALTMGVLSISAPKSVLAYADGYQTVYEIHPYTTPGAVTMPGKSEQNWGGKKTKIPNNDITEYPENGPLIYKIDYTSSAAKKEYLILIVYEDVSFQVRWQNSNSYTTYTVNGPGTYYLFADGYDDGDNSNNFNDVWIINDEMIVHSANVEVEKERINVDETARIAHFKITVTNVPNDGHNVKATDITLTDVFTPNDNCTITYKGSLPAGYNDPCTPTNKFDLAAGSSVIFYYDVTLPDNDLTNLYFQDYNNTVDSLMTTVNREIAKFNDLDADFMTTAVENISDALVGFFGGDFEITDVSKAKQVLKKLNQWLEDNKDYKDFVTVDFNELVKLHDDLASDIKKYDEAKEKLVADLNKAIAAYNKFVNDAGDLIEIVEIGYKNAVTVSYKKNILNEYDTDSDEVSFIDTTKYTGVSMLKEVQDADGNWSKLAEFDWELLSQLDGIVNYHLKITNTGTESITLQDLDDDLCDNANLFALLQKTKLQPGESVTVPYTHTFSEDDDFGSYIQNTATLKLDNEKTVTDSAWVLITDEETDIPDGYPNISIVKEANFVDDKDATGWTDKLVFGDNLGGMVYFKVTVTNSGDAPAIVKLTDILELPDGSTEDIVIVPNFILLGAEQSYVIVYGYNIAENIGGVSEIYVNTVSGELLGTEEVVEGNDAEVEVPGLPSAELSMIKEARTSTADDWSTDTIKFQHEGGTVYYRITITNTGNIAAKGVSFSDSMDPSLLIENLEFSNMANVVNNNSDDYNIDVELTVDPEVPLVITYQVTMLPNTGKTDETYNNAAYMLFNDEPFTGEIETIVHPRYYVEIGLDKKVRLAGADDESWTNALSMPNFNGGWVEYQITVTNTGTIPAEVTVADIMTPEQLLKYSDEPKEIKLFDFDNPYTLNPDEPATIITYFVFIPENESRTEVNYGNIATASWTDEVGPQGKSTEEVVVTVPAPDFGFSVTKEVREVKPEDGSDEDWTHRLLMNSYQGGWVEYRIVIENTGDTEIELQVSDIIDTDGLDKYADADGEVPFVLENPVVIPGKESHTINYFIFFEENEEGYTVTNTVTVTGDEMDEPAEDEATVVVPPLNYLEISKEVQLIEAETWEALTEYGESQRFGNFQGGWVRYRVTITAHGEGEIGFNLSDSMWLDEQYQWELESDTDIPTIVTVGEPLVITYRVLIPANTGYEEESIINTATVEWFYNDNPYSNYAESEVIVPEPARGLNIQKFVRLSGATEDDWVDSLLLDSYLGGPVDYMVMITNYGDQPVEIDFYDEMAPGNINGSYTVGISGGEVDESVLIILYTYNVPVNMGTALMNVRNTATMTWLENDGNQEMSAIANVIVPPPVYGISIAKYVRPAGSTSDASWTKQLTLPSNEGGDVEYLVVIRNLGNVITTVNFNDNMAPFGVTGEYTLEAANDPNGGDAVEITYTVTIPANTGEGRLEITNVATASWVYGGETEDTATVIVPPDGGIVVVKEVRIPSQNETWTRNSVVFASVNGGLAEYRITIYNYYDYSVTVDFTDMLYFSDGAILNLPNETRQLVLAPRGEELSVVTFEYGVTFGNNNESASFSVDNAATAQWVDEAGTPNSHTDSRTVIVPGGSTPNTPPITPPEYFDPTVPGTPSTPPTPQEGNTIVPTSDPTTFVEINPEGVPLSTWRQPENTEWVPNTIEQTEADTFIEIDDQGIPLGEWTEDDGEWTFESFIPLDTFEMPKTGEISTSFMILVCGFSLIALGGFLTINKRRGKSAKPSM